MQYVKFQYISVFKLTFSITFLQRWCKMKNKLYNLHLPFHTLVLIYKCNTYFTLYKLLN